MWGLTTPLKNSQKLPIQMKNLYKTYNLHLHHRIINDRTARQMVNSRKFVLFEEFDKILLELCPARKEGQTIPELYPAIPDWAEKYQ
jgi:hypothetical protein